MINFFGTLTVLGILVGIVSLALNIPLLRKVFRERARLKKLGLSSLSRSLWKESRRSRWSRWLSRAHGTLLIFAMKMKTAVSIRNGTNGPPRRANYQRRFFGLKSGRPNCQVPHSSSETYTTSVVGSSGGGSGLFICKISSIVWLMAACRARVVEHPQP